MNSGFVIKSLISHNKYVMHRKLCDHIHRNIS